MLIEDSLFSGEKSRQWGHAVLAPELKGKVGEKPKAAARHGKQEHVSDHLEISGWEELGGLKSLLSPRRDWERGINGAQILPGHGLPPAIPSPPQGLCLPNSGRGYNLWSCDFTSSFYQRKSELVAALGLSIKMAQKGKNSVRFLRLNLIFMAVISCHYSKKNLALSSWTLFY